MVFELKGLRASDKEFQLRPNRTKLLAASGEDCWTSIRARVAVIHLASMEQHFKEDQVRTLPSSCQRDAPPEEGNATKVRSAGVLSSFSRSARTWMSLMTWIQGPPAPEVMHWEQVWPREKWWIRNARTRAVSLLYVRWVDRATAIIVPHSPGICAMFLFFALFFYHYYLCKDNFMDLILRTQI